MRTRAFRRSTAARRKIARSDESRRGSWHTAFGAVQRRSCWRRSGGLACGERSARRQRHGRGRFVVAPYVGRLAATRKCQTHPDKPSTTDSLPHTLFPYLCAASPVQNPFLDWMPRDAPISGFAEIDPCFTLPPARLEPSSVASLSTPRRSICTQPAQPASRRRSTIG